MRLSLFHLALFLGGAHGVMEWLFPDGGGGGREPPGGGMDMSATFKRYTTCSSCVAAGHGWCPLQRKCGGFANKECGGGGGGRASRSPGSGSDGATGNDGPSSGQDMRALFATFRSCTACVAAGYGWCPMQRKCGGFASKTCDTDERYWAADVPSSQRRPPRNGLWKPRSAREEEVEEDGPTLTAVPAATPPPPATVLHAAPLRRDDQAAASEEAPEAAAERSGGQAVVVTVEGEAVDATKAGGQGRTELRTEQSGQEGQAVGAQSGAFADRAMALAAKLKLRQPVSRSLLESLSHAELVEAIASLQLLQGAE